MSLAERIEQWIAAQIEVAGVSGAVVGLSGGIDSAVVAGLCARALGPDNVLGVIMPAHSLPTDAADARLVAEAWGIEHPTIDLSGVVDTLMAILPEGTQLANANVKPRLRMIVLYYMANTLGRAVVGTGNRSELMVGYSTKYGDSGVDLLPLAGVYKHQVYEIAREIGVPQTIIDRPPSAGLWEGQTDEAEMGVTYADLDRVLAAMAAGVESGVSPDVVTRVQRMVRGSEHKRRLPPMFSPDETA
ncbi:MAG TPA: NAD(+) synthetase [Chloroflexi bacterium]|nr:NAD(+) synthetase [Chloroflexota bacterium]